MRRVQAGALLPSMILMHGTADQSMPPGNSTAFAAALRDAGAACELLYYEGKTHTDPLVEDPIKGGPDAFMEVRIEADQGQTRRHQLHKLGSPAVFGSAGVHMPSWHGRDRG